MKLRTFVLTAACAAALVTALPSQFTARAAAEDAPAASTGDKISFALTPAKGLSFATEAKMTMKQAISFGGMDIDTDMNMTTVARVDVTDVGETGDVTMKTTTTRLHGLMSNPMMGEIAFDSDKPEADADNPMAAQITQAFTAAVGQEISLVLAKDGTVKSGSGGAGEVSGAQVAELAGGIGTFPKNPVGVGDSWTSDTTRDMQGMKLNVKMKFTLKAFDADTATIAQTGEMSMAGAGGGDDGNPMAAALARMKMKSSKLEGTLKVSRKDGMAISSDVDSVIDMSMEADPNAEDPMAAGGMSMKMTMKMHQERKPASFADKKPVAPVEEKAGEAKPADVK